MSVAPLRRVVLKLLPEDRANVRFAFSPLWECVAAFRAWMDPSRHALLLPWISRIRSSVSRVEWEPLATLALVSRGTIPDFLAPPPTTPLPKLSDELTALSQVPVDIVRAEIEIAYSDGIPEPLKQALKTPRIFLASIATLLEKFWERALKSDWGLLRSRLEGEVLFRARCLALGGLDEVFKEMHRDVHYRSGRLTIETDSFWDGNKRRQGILLVPSIFSWPDVFLTVRPPWQPTITYTSRGVADLWSASANSSQDGLRILLGYTRTRVLTRLNRPQTTVETARGLKLSTAAASEQITKLYRAGLLERTRIGQRVFYALNEKGKTLLTTFDT